MKRKLLNLLIASSTTLPLISTLGLLSITSCSKEKISFEVTGTVKDTHGNILTGVDVCCNDQKIKTNSLGYFSIDCPKPASIIYFEKENYIGTAIKEFSYDEPLQVVLAPITEVVEKQIDFTVVNFQNQAMGNTSVTFCPDSKLYYQRFTTTEDGKFIGRVKVANEGDTFIPFVVSHATCDSQPQLLKINATTNTCTLVAQPYQYDVKAFVADNNENNHIIMHAYHIKQSGESRLKISLEANYLKAFDNNFTLTFKIGNDQSKPNKTEITGSDFSIDFNSTEVTKSHGSIVSGGDIKDIQVKLSKSKLYLDVIIPPSFYDFESCGTIGIHLTGSNGSFRPFDHKEVSTKASNQLSYVRLDENNNYFQASDNVNPFGDLNWDTPKTDPNWTMATGLDDEILVGRVGPIYNFGYQIKLAKRKTNATGIYILTKFLHDQMGHFLPDGYKPHFFFDPTDYGSGVFPELNAKPKEEDNIKHYAPFSGYWMKKYTVKSDTKPFEEEKNYDEFFDDPATKAEVYSKEDLMITYIPYTSIGIEATKDFGFTCNLQYKYTGAEWQAWVGNNPTGFNLDPGDGKTIPHFEYLATYIRFNSNLEVLPYSN